MLLLLVRLVALLLLALVALVVPIRHCGVAVWWVTDTQGFNDTGAAATHTRDTHTQR